jgi:hypothetical protein
MLVIRKASANFVGYNDVEAKLEQSLNTALNGVTSDNFKDLQFSINDDSVIASIFFGDSVTTGTPVQARVLQYDTRGYSSNLAAGITKHVNDDFSRLGIDETNIEHFSMRMSDKTLVVIILYH